MAQQANLIDAVRARDHTAVDALLSGGADPNMPDQASELTPLMFAAGLGDNQLVSRLIEANALVNAIDGLAGGSALHKACQGGNMASVMTLVDAGAWIDLQTTTTGHTPLLEAIWFTSDDIAEYLIARGARMELTTHYGFTIDQHVDYALVVNTSPQAKERLLRIRQLIADRRARDKALTDNSPLFASTLARDSAGVRKAIAEGADIEARYPIVGSFSDGHTALLIAARDGLDEIVRLLIDAKANPNAIEPVFGAVPLHKATYHGYAGITRALAAAPGVDLNYQGPSNGYTPLHDALWHGFPDCAAILLDAGARHDLVALDGKTPLDIARETLPAGSPLITRLQSLSGNSPSTPTT
jgi:ankyrin repeat protein